MSYGPPDFGPPAPPGRPPGVPNPYGPAYGPAFTQPGSAASPYDQRRPVFGDAADSAQTYGPQTDGSRTYDAAIPVQPAQPMPGERGTARLLPREIPVATTDTLPGRQIAAVLGEVIGVITRSREMRPSPHVIADLIEGRQRAVSSMVEMAVEAGAHAVVGMRFTGGAIHDQQSEITAYGTAVTLVSTGSSEAREA